MKPSSLTLVREPNKMNCLKGDTISDRGLNCFPDVSLDGIVTEMRRRILASIRNDGPSPSGRKNAKSQESRSSARTGVSTVKDCSCRNHNVVFPSGRIVEYGIDAPGQHMSCHFEPTIDGEKESPPKDRADQNKMMGRWIFNRGSQEIDWTENNETTSKKDDPSPHKRSLLDPKFLTIFSSPQLILFILSYLVSPAPCLAGTNDPFVGSAVSIMKETSLKIISITLYASGSPDLPTRVFLPGEVLSQSGIENPKGWSYDTVERNSPILEPLKKDPETGSRSLVTEILFRVYPAAKKTDFLMLGQGRTIFLLHLVPHPMMVKGTHVYSKNVTYWPPYRNFSSKGWYRLPLNHTQKDFRNPRRKSDQ